MSVLGQAGNALHLCLVQNQQHEGIVRNVPFALDSIFAGGSESESGIVVRVAYNNDEWATCILQFPIACFNQFASNSLALVFWKHCHGT